MLEDLNLPPKITNNSVWGQSILHKNDPVRKNNKTKHIDIKFFSVKHLKETGIIDLEYCPSKLMTVDVLIKRLPKPGFVKHKWNLLLLPHPVSEIKVEYWSIRNLLKEKREISWTQPFRHLHWRIFWWKWQKLNFIHRGDYPRSNRTFSVAV